MRRHLIFGQRPMKMLIQTCCFYCLHSYSGHSYLVFPLEFSSLDFYMAYYTNHSVLSSNALFRGSLFNLYLSHAVCLVISLSWPHNCYLISSYYFSFSFIFYCHNYIVSITQIIWSYFFLKPCQMEVISVI